MSYGQYFMQHNIAGAPFPLAPQAINSSSTHASAASKERFKQNRLPGIGQIISFRDGRAYIWATTEADLVAGAIVGMNSANIVGDIEGGLAAHSAGVTDVSLDVTGIDVLGAGSGVLTRDLLAGGYLGTTNADGEGYLYPIVSNTADGTGDVATLTLNHGLRKAVTDADTDVQVLGPVYRKVVAATSSNAALALGIATEATTAGTASEEQGLWIQVAGIAMVQIKTTTSITRSKALMVGDGGGAVIATAGNQVIGYALGTPSANGDFLPCMLHFPMGAIHA